jgi:hypothetical protein
MLNINRKMNNTANTRPYLRIKGPKKTSQPFNMPSKSPQDHNKTDVTANPIYEVPKQKDDFISSYNNQNHKIIEVIPNKGNFLYERSNSCFIMRKDADEKFELYKNYKDFTKTFEKSAERQKPGNIMTDLKGLFNNNDIENLILNNAELKLRENDIIFRDLKAKSEMPNKFYSYIDSPIKVKKTKVKQLKKNEDHTDVIMKKVLDRKPQKIKPLYKISNIDKKEKDISNFK